MATNPSKAVTINVSSSNGPTLNGSGTLDAGVYAVTGLGSTVTLNGSGDVLNSTIICDKFTLNGTPKLMGTSGYFTQPGSGTYQFRDSWQEVNGL